MLTALWLPIVLSGVFVFIASALINMLFKFWHAPDYRGFTNEDEIRTAIRSGNPGAPGQYAIELSHYDPVPAQVQKQLNEAYKPRVEEE